MATLAARQRLLVLYGSQTGCAKETAEAFHRMGLRRCFDCQVYALDAYDWRRLPNERLVLFVVSTTGDGDPPDNMVAFWKFLRNRHLPTTARSLWRRPIGTAFGSPFRAASHKSIFP